MTPYISHTKASRTLLILLVLLFGCEGLFGDIPEFQPEYCKENERVQDTYCVPCQEGATNKAGDFANTADNTQCDPIVCQDNQRVRSHQCVACNPGETSTMGDRATGPDTQCLPILCGENQYASKNQCVPCLGGERNAAGDSAAGPDTSCDGTSCKVNQRVQENMCVTCPLGTQNPAGDDATGADTTCSPTLCNQDEYVASNTCTLCPAGTKRARGDDASGADTSCEPVTCDLNQRVKSNACVSCPPGATRQAGDDASGADTQCNPTLCALNQRVQGNACVPCAGTDINAAGDDASGVDTFCKKFAFKSIDAGGAATCAITTADSVMCWGLKATTNTDIKDVTEPQYIKGLRGRAVQVSTGILHNCALMSTGAVMCWGYNEQGMLGDGTTVARDSSVEVVGLKGKTKQVSISYFSAALTEEGDYFTWGYDEDKMGYMVSKGFIPERLESISGGFVEICGFTTEGAVWCYGKNPWEAFESVPEIARQRPVPGVVRSISLGGSIGCVLTDSSGVWCWGANSDGQLGVGDKAKYVAPVRVSGLSNAIDVSSGEDHVCAIERDGLRRSTLCWGNNESGQLGISNTQDQLVPAAVLANGESFASVSAGGMHTCALNDAGQAFCWGSNKNGQLGNGTTTDSLVPVKVIIE